MSLLTLPRFDPATAGQGHAGFVRVAMQLTSEMRSLAATRMRDALRAGRLTPRTALAALKQGDVGVATLFRSRLSAALPRPVIDPATFSMARTSKPVDPRLKPALRRLMEVLAADGDLTADACRTMTVMTTRKVLLLTLSTAWQARCKRLVKPIADAIALGDDATVPFLPWPSALSALISHDEDEISRIDNRHVVVPLLSITGEPVVVLSLPVLSNTDDRSALEMALNAIKHLTGDVLMVEQEEALELLMGYQVEVIRDMALTVEWHGNDPQVDEDHFDVLEGEFGWDMRVGEAKEDLIAALRYFRERDLVERWTRDDPRFQRWQEAHQRTAIGTLVDDLLRLVDLGQQWQISPRVTPRSRTMLEQTEEGYLGVCMLPSDMGMDAWIEQGVNDLWNSYGYAEVTVLTGPLSVKACAKKMDDWVRACALVSASKVLVNRFRSAMREPAQPSEADGEEWP